ncbi:multidrug efflux protein YfmO [Alicyclobacillus acidoterrestris]|uniref:MFS transporter n=1 Tax=Alicyclobacillus suci TaxID=2816080 RepID=UPI001197FDB6|nr:MFS transporter [Alicyclobacillus suci]GEO26097.1 multidrug efflux protein YfmO [Alicyclobacillus acidoterrestris]
MASQTQDELAQKPARSNILNQPAPVFAVAFACIIAFMGLGLVDPILPAISAQLHASKAQTELLFTSYNLVTGVAMLITGFISTRIGPKWTLLIGLFIIVCFSFFAGHSSNVGQIVGFRAGWGLGNALFIATALSVIVGVARGTTANAIILYEAALGLGISVGPLLGGTLGAHSWRDPFYGVATLMAIGFICVLLFLRGVPRPAQRSSIVAPFKALKYKGLLTLALTALFYNFGFFTLLAYTPYPLKSIGIHGLGYVFFGWGVLLAITSVFVAPRLQNRFGLLPTMYSMLALITITLLVMAFAVHSVVTLSICVIVVGAFLGVNNTLVTTAVMGAAPVERPTASAAYSFVRFVGGGIAPWLAGKLSDTISAAMPFYIGALGVFIGIICLFIGKKALAHVNHAKAH